jgi:hypothetical protein
VKYLSLEER